MADVKTLMERTGYENNPVAFAAKIQDMALVLAETMAKQGGRDLTAEMSALQPSQGGYNPETGRAISVVLSEFLARKVGDFDPKAGLLKGVSIEMALASGGGDEDLAENLPEEFKSHVGDVKDLILRHQSFVPDLNREVNEYKKQQSAIVQKGAEASAEAQASPLPTIEEPQLSQQDLANADSAVYQAQEALNAAEKLMNDEETAVAQRGVENAEALLAEETAKRDEIKAQLEANVSESAAVTEGAAGVQPEDIAALQAAQEALDHAQEEYDAAWAMDDTFDSWSKGPRIESAKKELAEAREKYEELKAQIDERAPAASTGETESVAAQAYAAAPEDIANLQKILREITGGANANPFADENSQQEQFTSGVLDPQTVAAATQMIMEGQLNYDLYPTGRVEEDFKSILLQVHGMENSSENQAGPSEHFQQLLALSVAVDKVQNDPLYAPPTEILDGAINAFKANEDARIKAQEVAGAVWAVELVLSEFAAEAYGMGMDDFANPGAVKDEKGKLPEGYKKYAADNKFDTDDQIALQQVINYIRGPMGLDIPLADGEKDLGDYTPEVGEKIKEKLKAGGPKAEAVLKKMKGQDPEKLIDQLNILAVNNMINNEGASASLSALESAGFIQMILGFIESIFPGAVSAIIQQVDATLGNMTGMGIDGWGHKVGLVPQGLSIVDEVSRMTKKEIKRDLTPGQAFVELLDDPDNAKLSDEEKVEAFLKTGKFLSFLGIPAEGDNPEAYRDAVKEAAGAALVANAEERANVFDGVFNQYVRDNKPQPVSENKEQSKHVAAFEKAAVGGTAPTEQPAIQQTNDPNLQQGLQHPGS